MDRVAAAAGAASAATAIWDLERLIGVPAGLRDVGMHEEDLQEAITLVMEAVPDTDEAAIRTILINAYAGSPPQAMVPAALQERA